MKNFNIPLLILTSVYCVFFSCKPSPKSSSEIVDPISLLILEDKDQGIISIVRNGESDPILVQNAKEDFRPYIHPIIAPDGKGVLTEFSPGHHKHQTGLYWGFTQVNGRDYFHNPQGDYWKKVALNVIENQGEEVKWQTIYQLLDEKGEVVMEETQNWSMKEVNGKYFLDLEWKGEAKTDITIGKYDYGSLFVRMPWKEGINGEILNAARQRNENAEGQASMWINVAMQVEGRDDMANIAVFDHPENRGYPNKWRVDSQLGLGPAFTRDGDWNIEKGKTETIRHRLVMYTGQMNDVVLTEEWGDFTGRYGMYGTTELWRLAQEEGRKAKFLNPSGSSGGYDNKKRF
jgi:hypothetical protein